MVTMDGGHYLVHAICLELFHLLEKQTMKGIHVIQAIDFGIFNGTISFATGYSIKELRAFYKKKKCKDWFHGLDDIEIGKSCAGIAMERKYKNTHLYYLIIKKPFNFTDEDYLTLAHECLHLVQFRLKDVLDRDREFECEAYLHTYLMQQCLKAIRGYNK